MSDEEDKTVKTTPLPSVDEINTILSNPIKDPLVGTKLAGGRYEILDALGEGGMSVVYKAKQELVDRIVAIKTLKFKLLADPMLLKRFDREVKTLSRLNHPNIVTVYDCIIENGQPYFVMDYLQGWSLQDLLSSEKRIKPGRAKNIFSQVCNAVEHAHRNGIVHRDLKPANIMLMDISGQEFVKVVDFGLAKIGEEAQRLTQTGEIWGSPLYMSPEQCNGHELDARSDIYSLGACLYESLTGRVPFMGSTFLDTIQKVVNLTPPTFAEVAPDLKVKPEIEEIVMRCLEKNPEKRFQSMAEMKDAIDRTFPADEDALFRTLPPNKMVVDKNADQQTRELKRDPQSVIATKRLRRPDSNEGGHAEEEIAGIDGRRAPSKAIASKSSSSAEKSKSDKSTTIMAGVIGGLIAACAVVVVGFIQMQPSAPPAVPPSPPAAPPSATAPSATAPAANAPAATAPAATAPAATAPAANAPAANAPAATAPAATAPAVTAPAVTAPASTAPAVTDNHEMHLPALTEDGLKAIDAKFDPNKTGAVADNQVSGKPSAVKSARKPVHKVAHTKPPRTGSPPTVYVKHSQSARELDDSEVWQGIRKY